MHGVKLPQSERRKKQKGPFVKEIWWWFKQIKAVVRWGFFQLGSRTWQLLTCTWTRLKDGAFAAAARDFGAAFPFNDFFHLVWNPPFLQRGNWAHAGCSEARPTLANTKLHPEASWWTQRFVLLWIWLEAEALNSSDYCWLSLACECICKMRWQSCSSAFYKTFDSACAETSVIISDMLGLQLRCVLTLNSDLCWRKPGSMCSYWLKTCNVPLMCTFLVLYFNCLVPLWALGGLYKRRQGITVTRVIERNRSHLYSCQ